MAVVVILQLEEEELGDTAHQRQGPGHSNHHLYTGYISARHQATATITCTQDTSAPGTRPQQPSPVHRIHQRQAPGHSNHHLYTGYISARVQATATITCTQDTSAPGTRPQQPSPVRYMSTLAKRNPGTWEH